MRTVIKVLKADNFAGVNRLELMDNAVGHKNGVVAATTDVYPYAQISCVLLSKDGELSIHEGRNVAKVQMKVANEDHQAFLQELLNRIRRAQGRGIVQP